MTKARFLTSIIIIFLALSSIFLLRWHDSQTTSNNFLENLNNLSGLDDVAYARAGVRDNTQLLARAVNGEGRGESYIGQVAIAAVILNRVNHPAFPKSIPGVIYQPGAFTAVSDGQINVPIATNATVYKASVDAMNGWDPTHGCIYYYNPAKTTNQWIWSRPVVTVIGQHRFAK